MLGYLSLGASLYDGCSDGGNWANAATAKAVSKMHAFHAILLGCDTFTKTVNRSPLILNVSETLSRNSQQNVSPPNAAICIALCTGSRKLDGIRVVICLNRP